MKKFYLCFFALILLNTAFAQSDCSSAIIACGNTQPFNPSGIGSKLEQLACGGIEHNSIWVAFQAKANGKLNFVIRPFTPAGLPSNTDFDWSLYALPGAPGTGNCDAKTQLSCNFAGTAVVFGIPGATGLASPPYVATQFNPGVDVTSGNWYVIIIDQFSNTIPLLFSVQFTGNPESPYLNSTPGIFDNRPDFTITNTSACNGLFNFTNTSVATSGINSYLWDFGDGTTSTAVNPAHTYATPGTYFVTLTVADNNGCSSDIRQTVVYNNTAPVVTAGGIFATPSCSDGNNGSLTVTATGAATPGVTGGTIPYTYELISPSPMIRAPQSSNTFTGLQPGGYTVKVTDACGKSATGTVTVTQVVTNSTIGITIQNIQSACTGSATGTAAFFANGTAPPYTFRLINNSPVLAGPIIGEQRDPVTASYYATFTSLLPGVYTLEVTDGCGKIRRATFTVTPSTAPIATAVASASCNNSPTGTLTVTPNAATGLSGAGSPGTYQYALISPSPGNRPFQNSSVFENLWPGTYTVATKDACGNIGTAAVAVPVAVAPTFGTAFTTTSCPNANTGTIEAQINTAGGGSPYTFALIAPSPLIRPPQTSNLFSALTPGAYTVLLTDACNTQVTSVVTVNAATAPTFTTTLTGSCASPASGTITVTPGATAISPFTFELISPGAAIRPPQGSNIANSFNSIFTGLNQGIYTIRMIDGCSVPVTNNATIIAPVTLTFPAGSTVIPSCAASPTGRITVAIPANGLGAYKYELIAPSALIAAPQYSRIFNNLPAGNYTVRITDSCGSQVTIGAPLTIAVSTAPTLSVTNTSSCVTNTGTITALATAANQGGGTYQYALIAPSPAIRPNQASPIFTGLPAGAYTVQITDQCGVTGTTTTTITAAGAFTPAITAGIVACNGSGYYGEIIVSTPQNFTPGGPIPPGSGGGPYLFSLYDATNTTLIAGPQASNVFTNVAPVAGTPTHTIRVTDVCVNTSTVTATLNAPVALTNAVIAVTTLSCAATNTGVIRVSTQATGGLPPYSYSLINAVTTAVVAGPQSSLTFTNVAALGTGYFVRVTDACGNITTSAAALLFAAAAAPTVTAATTPSCATPATGRVIATPGTGATLAGGTFSYALYDAANTTLLAGPQAGPAFANLAPATYTVRIVDQCGLTGTVTATVSSTVTAPTAAGTATGTCTGGNNGVITGSSTNGSLPITYTLVDQPSSTVVAGPQAGNVFNGLIAGTYIVRVTDACGTVVNSSNIVLGNLAATPTVTTTQAIDCSGSAILSGYGGGGNGGPFTYAICTGAGCSGFGAFSGVSTYTIVSSGTYRIAVRDRCGNQTISGDVVVTIPTKPVITGVTNATICGTTTITPAFTGVPNTPYFSLDGANFSPTIGSVTGGCHTLRVANFNTGAFGCSSDPFDFSVVETPTLRPASAADGWVVNCTSGSVIPAITPATGTTGCTGSGITFGVKLSACTGCNITSDPIGTVRAVGAAFNMRGASNATFAPALVSSGTDICTGTTVLADFTNPATFGCLYALPLAIEYFDGSNQGSNNVLNWKIDCDNKPGATISLERSALTTNGFTSIYTITPDLNRCSQPFAFTDAQPLNGMNYYRLKLTGIDNQTIYSRIIALRNNSNGFNIVSIVPNPVKNTGKAMLNITGAETGKMKIVIADMAGRKLHTEEISILAGANQVPVNVLHLAGGLYQLTAYFSNGSFKTVRFVKE